MKLYKKLSVLIAIVLVFGAIGVATPKQVEAQEPNPKFSVLELITSAS